MKPITSGGRGRHGRLGDQFQTGDRHLHHDLVVEAGRRSSEVERRAAQLEIARGFGYGKRAEQRDLVGKDRLGLARRQREVAAARLDHDILAAHVHLDAPEASVERRGRRDVAELVVAGDVGGDLLRARLEVVGVGDHEAAGAFGEVAQHALDARAQGRLGGLAELDLVLADRTGPPARHRLLAHALRFLERVAGAGHLLLGREPAGVDRVDAHVGAVGLRDHRAEDRVEVRGHVEPLGEIQQRLAAGEGLLALDERDQGIQRARSHLLALQRVRHAQHVGKSLRLRARGEAATLACPARPRRAVEPLRALELGHRLLERGLLVRHPDEGARCRAGDRFSEPRAVVGERLHHRQPLVHAEDRDEGVGAEPLLEEGLRRPLRLAAAGLAELVEHERHQAQLARGVRRSLRRALDLRGEGLDPFEAIECLAYALFNDLDLACAKVQDGAALLVAYHDVQRHLRRAGREGRLVARGGNLGARA